ncbi:MAG: aldo/keto reductase [Erysipelothrix sp.]|nr:aldo/keto reductase [Erysipelothrix sp.]
MEKVRLNNGELIDIVGSGTNTFGKEDHKYMNPINMDTTEYIMAIENGYRHFDTAISYRNEEVLAKAISESAYLRETFFITSKIPGSSPYIDSAEKVRESVQMSLDALNTDYIDMYLIHHSWDNMAQMLKVWDVLETFVDKKIIKSIGVSNFDIDTLKTLHGYARIKPAVNQIESHPGFWNHQLIEACNDLGVKAEAWGPLSFDDIEAKSILSEIGQKYQKTWAQVVLRYQIQRGVIVIPKSHDNLRQKQNIDIFDFELSIEEVQKISGL